MQSNSSEPNNNNIITNQDSFPINISIFTLSLRFLAHVHCATQNKHVTLENIAALSDGLAEILTSIVCVR